MLLQVKAASTATSGGAAARAELGLDSEYSATSSGQRERMLQSTEKLARTGDRITQGRQQLLETEVRHCGPAAIQSTQQKRFKFAYTVDRHAILEPLVLGNRRRVPPFWKTWLGSARAFSAHKPPCTMQMTVCSVRKAF